ncbi:unnamed protein product, partial [Ectocarpus sp. 6 AP-2014]
MRSMVNPKRGASKNTKMRARGWHGREMPSGSMSRPDKKTKEGSRPVSL